MRTTVELSDRTYRLLRARAAEQGMRGFSPLVETAIVRFLEGAASAELAGPLAAAEGAWSEAEVAEWERVREKAWSTWPQPRSSTPTS